MAKTKYDPDWLPDIEAWAGDGLTDEQIYFNLGIVCDTFYNYKKNIPEFSEALKKGRIIKNQNAENAQYKRVIGYEYTETTQEGIRDEETGEITTTKIKKVTKEIPGNVTAQIFYLKNQMPEAWSDRRDINLGVTLADAIKALVLEDEATQENNQ